MMYILAAISLVVLGIVTLYTLITCGKNNPLVIAVLIPLTLAAGTFSIYTLNFYRGLPLEGFPPETVTIQVIQIGKPDILILGQLEDEQAIRYWSVPYTEDNAEAAANAKRNMGEGKPVKGQFKRVNRLNSDEQVMRFQPSTNEFKDDK